jgi:hypothetical protein
MTIPCPICQGRCGKFWQRAVMDSWDFHAAQCVGSCGFMQQGNNSGDRRSLGNR